MMLQHVLRDMYIDPELLNGLEEFEKETLFCCMRAEQIKRWKQWDQKQSEGVRSQSPPRSKRIGSKSVKWLLDDRGEPVVDVIDSPCFDAESENSKSADCELNELNKEFEQKELRLSIKDGRCVDLNGNEPADKQSSQYVNIVSNSPCITSSPSVIVNFNEKRGALQELSLNKVPKVARQVAEWEKRVTQDSPKSSPNKLAINTKKIGTIEPAATANEIQQEQQWREQQKKFKETETRMRTIARLAREEHRRSFVENQNDDKLGNFVISSSASIDDIRKNILKPPSNEVILDWYRSKELPKNAGLESNNKAADWFHGLVSRKEADDSLADEKEGTFLVRISEHLWSYTISLKSSQGIKHYLIDASSGRYQFRGTDKISHSTLGELVAHHKTNSLTESKNEFLLFPCLKEKNVSTLFGTTTLL